MREIERGLVEEGRKEKRGQCAEGYAIVNSSNLVNSFFLRRTRHGIVLIHEVK